MQADGQVAGSPWKIRWEFAQGQSFEVGGARSPLALPAAAIEQIRWYFEDYAELRGLPGISGEGPDHAVARRVETLLKATGANLFEVIRGLAPAEAQSLIRDSVGAAISIAGDTDVLWELLWSPGREAPEAVFAQTFVRTAGERRPERLLKEELRILYIVSRPFGEGDLPFRTVARAVMERLPDQIPLGSLRAVSLEGLGRELQRARESGSPWTVVHFDGHGTIDAQSGRSFAHFASFGQPGTQVDGSSFGRLLAEFGVSILVLNACRSASQLPLRKPGERAEETAVVAYGSLAEEALRQGVPGVLGMGYAVYPETAAQVASELYIALANGATLGEAAAAARRALWAGKSGFADWAVPVAYEAEPVRFRAVGPGRKAAAASAEAGPVERDAFVARLEQALEQKPAALIHGEAGVGKTTAAWDFIRWFRRTRPAAVDLFTSFQRIPSLETLAFQSNYLAEQAAAGKTCLWVWDNVESLETLTEEQRSEMRQRCAALLKEATCCLVLVTSRRAELEWLGSEVQRLVLPRLNARESLTLAGRLGAGRIPSAAFSPLIEYAAGNPLTLRMLVGSALRSEAVTEGATSALIAQLRATHSFPAEDEAATETLATFEWVFRSILSPSQRDAVAVLKLFGSTVHPKIIELLALPANERAWQPLVAFGAEACRRLLHELSDLGALHPANAAFEIHPLAQLFIERCWRQLEATTRSEAAVAFVSAVTHLADGQLRRRESRQLTSHLEAAPYEECLLAANQLAREHEMFSELELLVKVLGPLFGAQNRPRDHWRLYEELVPLYIEPVSHDPKPGREGGWNLIMAALEGLAHSERDYGKAEALYEQHLRILRSNWESARTHPASEERTRRGRDLAAVLKSYAFLRRETSDGRSVDLLKEAYGLAVELKWTRLQADLAADLAESYLEVAAVLDLDVAEIWVGLALRLRGEERTEARTQSLLICGRILLLRFLRLEPAARAAPAGKSLMEQTIETLQSAHADAASISDGVLQIIEFNLGAAYMAAGIMEQAHTWFHSVLARAAQLGDARVTQTVHAILAQAAIEAGRPEDAKAYAASAVSGPKSTPYDQRINELLQPLLDQDK